MNFLRWLTFEDIDSPADHIPPASSGGNTNIAWHLALGFVTSSHTYALGRCVPAPNYRSFDA
jgi:hypothetical protein